MLLLCACGGGGGGGSSPVIVAPATPTPVPTPTPGPGTATFALSPDATSSITGAQRRPRYVSASTASITIVVNGAGTASVLNLYDPAHCDASKKCTLGLSAPPGNDTFLVSAYDQPNGAGNLLSRATVSAVIAANAVTVVPAILSGNVAAITVTLGNALPALHQTTTIPVTVVAKDAGGNTIVGPGGYLYPITLTDSDGSGHSSLSKTTLNGPGDVVTLQYDGGYAGGAVGASALGAQTTTAAAFAPSSATTETPLSPNRTAHSIIVGPDGALWFAEQPGYLGRITTGGALTETLVPGNWNPAVLCAGPDGAIWFSAQNMSNPSSAILRRATDGTISVFPLASGYQVENIVAAADGNLWFNQTGQLGRITPQGAITMMHLTDANSNPLHVDSLTAGPDNALWFGEGGYDALDRFDLTTQAITMHLVRPLFGGTPTAADPTIVIAGPDQRLYFSAFLMLLSSDTAGNMTTIYSPVNGIGYVSLAFAPDASLWFAGAAAQNGKPQFGRIAGGAEVTITGTTAQSGIPSVIDSLAAGPDGALYYTRGNAVGRMVP